MSEKEGFRFRLKKDVSAKPSAKEITTSQSVNYGESFLLMATLSYKLGDGDIQRGAIKVVEQLYKRAKLVQAGTEQKAESFSELLFVIDPELDDDNVEKIDTLMLEVMGKLLRGEVLI